MARKFLQIGWTPARRYGNYKSARKYEKQTGDELPRTEGPGEGRSGGGVLRAVCRRTPAPGVPPSQELPHRAEREIMTWIGVVQLVGKAVIAAIARIPGRRRHRHRHGARGVGGGMAMLNRVQFLAVFSVKFKRYVPGSR